MTPHPLVYHPPRWLRGAHLETIYPALFLKLPPPEYRREIWVTPDGDEIAIDWLADSLGDDTSGADKPADDKFADNNRPLVVHFHGLEGSSRSHYAAALMHATGQRGWRGAVAHFRGCGGHANRKPRAYHAGDTREIDWILRRFRAQHTGPLFALGVSLGGNALAKWLGEQGEAARSVLAAAAVVSAPLDLSVAGAVLDRGFNRQVYTREFLRSLRPKTLRHLAAFADELAHLKVSPRDIAAASSFSRFDDQVTAPLHGFSGVHDYWRRASAKPLLPHIAVPTLLINARNDPFYRPEALPGPQDVSPLVTLLQPERGGHVGFVEGHFPGRLDWLPRVALHYFSTHVTEP